MDKAALMAVSILVSWASATLGLWLAANMLRGVQLRSFADALWAGALLGFLQWLLTWPLFILLGLGTFGIGFLLWFVTRWVASALVILVTAALSSRLQVRGFWNALATAFIVAATGSVLRWFL